MPLRISRASVSVSKPNNPRKRAQKRSLNAISVAAQQHPETSKVRHHRLGEIEDDGPQHGKRRRLEDDEDDLEGGSEEGKSHSRPKGRRAQDDSDIEEGSDSEGHTWTLGHVDEDEDTEVDSDEAFGESDEEKFEGWTFRGSSSGTKGKKAKKTKVRAEENQNDEIDLDEQSAEEGNSEDGESLGEDAIDLATALDQYEASDSDSQKDPPRKQPKLQLDSEDEEYADSDSASASDSDDADTEEDDMNSQFSMSEAEDGDDTEKLARIQDLISTLHPTEEAVKRKVKHVDPQESQMPSTTSVSREKFDINDLLAMPNTGQRSRESIKAEKMARKIAKKGKALQPSLPKRQKDRLERIAANTKAKETLGRWVDTVKHNRRAEHLHFPLEDPDVSAPLGVDKLLPTSSRKPFNDLEGAIQKIMEESGLSAGRADAEEEQIRAFEELQANRMSLEEVQARRAELRKARELLFREEVRAKRIKKIKSKSYRRVHRKEREKLAALERDQFAAGGSDIDEEERERMDRRRAEERMGAKHRDSKWAKQMKKSGRAVWDEDARSGVTDMARRNEELRRRIEGKTVRSEDDDGSASLSSEDEESEASNGDEEAQTRRIQRRLDRLTDADADVDDGPGSRLMSMQFMQRAEAARKAENDETIERIRRELAGEASSEESEQETVGRKLFGPNRNIKLAVDLPEKRNEFEEQEERNSDEEIRLDADGEGVSFTRLPAAFQMPSKSKSKASKSCNVGDNSSMLPNNMSGKVGLLDKPKRLPKENVSQSDAEGWQTVTYDHDDEERAEDPASENHEELIRQLFAGDEVEEAFEAEKNDTIKDEDDKIIDNTLPGWGTWVGEGLSVKQQKRNKGRFLTKQEGIKPEDRKDAKLKNVIINQKRLKKSVGYLASSLPFPFQTKAEYERSIRMPVGQEWNVKTVYQDNTKPRVLVKTGRIISPIEKPMV